MFAPASPPPPPPTSGVGARVVYGGNRSSAVPTDILWAPASPPKSGAGAHVRYVSR